MTISNTAHAVLVAMVAIADDAPLAPAIGAKTIAARAGLAEEQAQAALNELAGLWPPLFTPDTFGAWGDGGKPRFRQVRDVTDLARRHVHQTMRP